MRFLGPPPGALHVVPLGDGLTAIFHRPSGITHLLMEPAPQILVALDRPATVADVLARLEADYDVVDADAAMLAVRLDELVAAGLVVRV